MENYHDYHRLAGSRSGGSSQDTTGASSFIGLGYFSMNMVLFVSVRLCLCHSRNIHFKLQLQAHSLYLFLLTVVVFFHLRVKPGGLNLYLKFFTLSQSTHSNLCHQKVLLQL